MSKKNITIKSDEVREEPAVELLRELIKINKEIRDILLRIKDRFV